MLRKFLLGFAAAAALLSAPLGAPQAQHTSAIPKWYVRFDDGRNAPYITNQIQAFLRRGIPVTLALNMGSIDENCDRNTTPGDRLCWEYIRRLQRLALNNGTKLEIANHSRLNFSTLTAQWTEGDLRYELDGDIFARRLGEWARPKVYIQPGGAEASWPMGHWDLVEEILRERGYIGAWVPGPATGDSLRWNGFHPTNPADIYQRPNGSKPIKRLANDSGSWKIGVRPGPHNDPFFMSSGSTLDLGNYVVERHLNSPSRSNTWYVGAHPTLTGVASADYLKTWGAVYSGTLASNLWMSLVLHDSVHSNTETIDFKASSVQSSGHFSPDHVAWTLAELQRKGHVKLVTATEWFEGIDEYYAPGTDLIGNPELRIPQFDIGDTIGMHFPVPRGLGTRGFANDDIVNARFAFYVPFGGTKGKVDSTGLAALGRDHFYKRMGPGVAGPLGSRGGVDVGWDGSSDAMGLQIFSMGHLAPGRYRYTFWVKPKATGATDVRISNVGAAAIRLRWLTEANVEAPQATSFATADTIVSVVNNFPNKNLDLEEGGPWQQVRLYFTLPDDPLSYESYDRWDNPGRLATLADSVAYAYAELINAGLTPTESSIAGLYAAADQDNRWANPGGAASRPDSLRNAYTGFEALRHRINPNSSLNEMWMRPWNYTVTAFCTILQDEGAFSKTARYKFVYIGPNN